MATWDVSDRWTRYTIDMPLRYRRVAKGGGRSKGGRGRNLNVRGAWVDLPEQVEPGSVLEIALATPAVSLSLVARVAWAHARLRDAHYLHGVRFTGVTPALRNQLCALLAHQKPPAARLSCMLAATCDRSWKGHPTLPGIIRDLSGGGACVCLPQRIAPGLELRIQAATPFGKIVANAQVAWANHGKARLPRGRLCRHGLRFLHLHALSELPLHALLLCGIR